MDYYSLFTSQITDIFRIGLLAGLIYTIERTRLQTGVVIPILAGLMFVAVIIPSTMPEAGADMWAAIVTGVVANAVIFSVLWGVWSAVRKVAT